MSAPKIIAWNCRDVGSKVALQHLLISLRTHVPNILILCETQVPSTTIQRILNKSHLDKFIVSEALGFIGGIWMLWNNSTMELELVAMDNQVVAVEVKQPGVPPWMMSAIYASTQRFLRELLWDYMIQMAKFMNIPWLVLGDFNQIMDPTEKKEGDRCHSPALCIFLRRSMIVGYLT